MRHRSPAVLAARATICLLLIGVPAVLVLLAGNPLPTSRQWSAIFSLEPDWGDTVLLGSVLPCLAWVAWSLFAYPLIAELLRHRVGHPFLPVGALLRGQEQVAAALVTAALLSSTPALAAHQATAAIAVSSLGASQVDLVALNAPARGIQAASRRIQSTTSTVTTYQVKKGDTLWGIAERRLGDGADYPAIVEQSAGVVQPDGRQLADPDLILPGWNLDIPSTDHTAPHTRATSSQAHPGPRPTATATSPLAPTPAPAAPASPRGIDEGTASDDPNDGSAGVADVRDADVVPVAIGGGVAALLAAGLVTALTGRRRRQRAERSFGERLPLPNQGPARGVENQLRAISDSGAVAALHRALALVLESARQNSAPLPSLFAVRIDDDELTLYLHGSVNLPEPFHALFDDGTAWTAPRDAFTTPVDPDMASPYPALTTIGTDLDGGILLLDLEQQTHLIFTSGDDATARGMLNALTAELASSPWGEDIHLSLVGVPDRLATELDPYRIHCVADTSTLIRDIRTHLADRRTVLDAAGVPDVRTARIHLADLEAWAPFVVLIGTPPTADEQTDLDALIRQHAATGLVIVTAHSETPAAPEIVLTDRTATYRSGDPTLPPLPFIPQLLDEHTLEQVLEIFARAAATSDGAQSHAPEPDTAPSLGVSTTVFRVNEWVESPGVVESLDLGVPLRDMTSKTLTSPTASRGVESDHGDASDKSGEAPYLHLLGQVEIQHVDRADLIPGRGIELLAYVLNHRQPVAGAQIQKALWPTSCDRSNGNLRSLAKQVRAALGHDPDGHLWLPEGRGNAGFTTHPAIRSDWDDFKNLMGPDPTAVPTEQLAAALRLVHGQPLLGTDGHRGRWAWRAPWEETIIAAIHDVAMLVGERATAGGDRDLIKLAVRAARFADPLSELSWQIELRAAIASATTAQVDRIVSDLHATAGYGHPDYEPDADTTMLIRAAQMAAAARRR